MTFRNLMAPVAAVVATLARAGAAHADPAAAGASAFRTVVQAKLRPGDFYQDAGGAWVKK